MTIVGVNHCQHILHMSKIMVHCYTTDENINPFSIGYIINPSLKCDNVFKIQVEIFLSVLFSFRTIKNIKDFLMKNNTCVMVLLIFYENNGEIPKTLFDP